MVDCTKTFPLVFYLNSFDVLISLDVDQAWQLHQLDISNDFFYEDFSQHVFMKKPSRYVAWRSPKVCQF